MEPNDGGTTSARAQELRASLSARRQVEELLAEASAARRAAAADADALVEEAQQLSADLLAESRLEAADVVARAHEEAQRILARARDEAEGTTRQARAAADAVRARAEAEVEEHRRRVRQEVTDQVSRELAEANRRELLVQHERQDAMIGDLEASVRILGVSLDSASANVGELLAALDGLRAHTGDALPHGTPPRHAEPDDLPYDGDHDDEPVVEVVEVVELAELAEVEPELEPEPGAPSEPEHDWTRASAPPRAEARDDLFRPTAPERAGRDLWSARDAEEARNAEREAAVEDDPPRSATEAFLRSAHLDHGDPPLPPLDDTDVGARYARDAMRATARARTRQDEETLGVSPERPSPPRTGADERRDGAPGADGHAQTRSDDRGDGARQDDRPGADPRHDREGKPLGWLFRSS